MTIYYSFTGKTGKLNFRTGWKEDLVQAAKRYGMAVAYINTGGLLLSVEIYKDLTYKVNIPARYIKTICRPGHKRTGPAPAGEDRGRPRAVRRRLHTSPRRTPPALHDRTSGYINPKNRMFLFFCFLFLFFHSRTGWDRIG